MSINPVDNAIAAAKQKAATAATAAPQAPAVIDAYAQQSNGMTVYAPTKQKTIDDLGAYGFDVDTFLKVNEFGLSIKGKDGLFDSAKVLIDTSSKGLQIFECVKYGNPAVYHKTYDNTANPNARCVTGGLWLDALRKTAQVDPNARPYEGADITMTLLDDIKVTVKGQSVTLAEKGTTLGHSTSTTNKANLKAFIDQILQQGLKDTIVEVEVSYEKKTNAKGNEWGVLTFNLLGEHNPDA